MSADVALEIYKIALDFQPIIRVYQPEHPQNNRFRTSDEILIAGSIIYHKFNVNVQNEQYSKIETKKLRVQNIETVMDLIINTKCKCFTNWCMEVDDTTIFECTLRHNHPLAEQYAFTQLIRIIEAYNVQ